MLTNDFLIAIGLTMLAGMATGIGSLITYFLPEPDLKYLSVSLGFAAGVMIFVSFVDLFYGSRGVIGLNSANFFFMAGLLLMYGLDRALPHIHMNGAVDRHGDSRLCRTGIMTTIGVAIHNFPEGMTVALVSLADIRLGIPIAIAIALHNIPEGVACSMPLYCATADRKRACMLSFLAGMTEPLGAVAAILILYPFLSPYVLAMAMAFVAGIMVLISFDELIPIANKYGDEHLTIIGLISGFLVMMLGLSLM